jgi:hypothetical protein
VSRERRLAARFRRLSSGSIRKGVDDEFSSFPNAISPFLLASADEASSANRQPSGCVQPSMFELPEDFVVCPLINCNNSTPLQSSSTWNDFMAGNRDLLTWSPSVLTWHYRDETLKSDLARRIFVMPDRLSQ